MQKDSPCVCIPSLPASVGGSALRAADVCGCPGEEPFSHHEWRVQTILSSGASVWSLQGGVRSAGWKMRNISLPFSVFSITYIHYFDSYLPAPDCKCLFLLPKKIKIGAHPHFCLNLKRFPIKSTAHLSPSQETVSVCLCACCRFHSAWTRRAHYLPFFNSTFSLKSNCYSFWQADKKAKTSNPQHL